MKLPAFSFLTPPPDNSFRNDINALRAWAVMAVVFYHFGVPGFSGGFVGVDVFFVISGFLMTGIITQGLENKHFSLIDFYFARVRRILPGLIGLCLSVLVIGWLLLAPDDYVKMAQHVQDALSFSSNNTFRKEAGYFDALSHDKWLLHTWSLSVEWQFYIILPLLMYPVWFFTKSKKWLLGVFLVFAMCSFFACISKTNSDATKAFYMLKYRSWEMFVGGLVYFLSEHKKLESIHSKILFYFGFVLIIGSIVLIDSDSLWPGYLAFVPVLGAALAVLSAEKDVWLNKISLMHWVGARSYSVYLFHWPIVVLLAYFQKSESVLWIASGVILSLVLGHISYIGIENPARKGFGLNKYMSAMAVALTAVIVYSWAMYVVRVDGFPYRVDDFVVKLSNEQRNTAKNARDCIFGDDKKKGALSCTYGPGPIKAIVLGDSHAAALVTGVQSAINGDDGAVYLWSRAACPFIRGVTAKIDQDCDSFIKWVFEHIKNEPVNIPVVLISRSSLYAFGGNEGVAGNKIIKPPVYFDKPYDSPTPEFLEILKERSISTICELANDRKVYLVRPIPEMKVSVPQFMARYKMMGIERRVSIPLTEYYARHQFIFALQDEAKARCGVEILDPVPYLCDKENCYGDLNGWPLYFDDDHLSEFGNKVLVPMFSRIFNIE